MVSLFYGLVTFFARRTAMRNVIAISGRVSFVTSFTTVERADCKKRRNRAIDSCRKRAKTTKIICQESLQRIWKNVDRPLMMNIIGYESVKRQQQKSRLAAKRG